MVLTRGPMPCHVGDHSTSLVVAGSPTSNAINHGTGHKALPVTTRKNPVSSHPPPFSPVLSQGHIAQTEKHAFPNPKNAAPPFSQVKLKDALW